MQSMIDDLTALIFRVCSTVLIGGEFPCALEKLIKVLICVLKIDPLQFE